MKTLTEIAFDSIPSVSVIHEEENSVGCLQKYISNGSLERHIVIIGKNESVTVYKKNSNFHSIKGTIESKSFIPKISLLMLQSLSQLHHNYRLNKSKI